MCSYSEPGEGESEPWVRRTSGERVSRGVSYLYGKRSTRSGEERLERRGGRAKSNERRERREKMRRDV